MHNATILHVTSDSEPSEKRTHRNNLSTQEHSQGPKCSLSYSANAFLTSKERTTSLQRTNWLDQTCP